VAFGCLLALQMEAEEGEIMPFQASTGGKVDNEDESKKDDRNGYCGDYVFHSAVGHGTDV
jgi:hypothetical protein